MEKAEVIAKLDAVRAKLVDCDPGNSDLDAISQQVDGIARLLPEGKPPFPPQYRIRELKGLGKEFWRSIDVDAYLKKERASWR